MFHKLKLLTTNCHLPVNDKWHLLRALPVTEQQGQSPFASAEIEPCGAAAADFTSPGSSGWNEALRAPGNLAEQVFRCVRCAVTQLCPTLYDPMDWTLARQAPLPMGTLQARIQDWVAYPFARVSS